MKLLLAAILIASASATGCVSPEATRTRGGGPGGDTGNRPRDVKMHEGSYPFWKTPERIKSEQAPPLAPAAQARERSRQ
jgi:hypothetical protein